MNASCSNNLFRQKLMHEKVCDTSSLYPVFISDTRQPGISPYENNEIRKRSNSPGKNDVSIRKILCRGLAAQMKGFMCKAFSYGSCNMFISFQKN